MKLALDSTTMIHLDNQQLRQARLYAWLHGVSLAEAVAELAMREQKKKREAEQARVAFKSMQSGQKR